MSPLYLPYVSLVSLYLACISPYLLEALRSAKAFERQLESSAEQADVGEMQGRCRGDTWEIYGRCTGELGPAGEQRSAGTPPRG
jgi:hypothetical protein